MTKRTELALSLKAIRETVYALSAMHSYMSPYDRPMPPLLSADQKEGIDQLIRHSITGLANEYPEGIVAGQPDHDTVTITAVLRPDKDAASVRRTIEHILVARTMWECHTGVDNETADRYRTMYTESADSLKKSLGTTKPPLKLHPQRY